MQNVVNLARISDEETSADKLDESSIQKNNDPEPELVVDIFASANLPTKHGQFRIVAFTNNFDDKEHVAVINGEVKGHEDVITRIHSECLTGDVLGSLKCDCGPQLDMALQEIAGAERGMVLYMRQEGRGIGLANKIKAYGLQDSGLDTVEANLHLGFDDDLRDYRISAEMIKLLGVKSIALLTNNPSKVDGLEQAGVVVSSRRPIKAVPNPHNAFYLATKRQKSGHLL